MNRNYSIICEIERILKKGRDVQHAKYDKGEIEGKKLKIKDILDALNRQSSLPIEDESSDGRALQSLSLDPHDLSITPVSEKGRSWPHIHRSDMER